MGKKKTDVSKKDVEITSIPEPSLTKEEKDSMSDLDLAKKGFCPDCYKQGLIVNESCFTCPHCSWSLCNCGRLR